MRMLMNNLDPEVAERPDDLVVYGGIGKAAQFLMVRSKDDGLTWSKPENLTKKLKQESWWLLAPSPQSGFQLADGTLVMPSEYLEVVVTKTR